MELLKIQILMSSSRPPGSGLKRLDPGSSVVNSLVVLQCIPKICFSSYTDNWLHCDISTHMYTYKVHEPCTLAHSHSPSAFCLLLTPRLPPSSLSYFRAVYVKYEEAGDKI